MAEEKVIELSFEESNKLRESLGLKPLRSSTRPKIEDAPLPPSAAELEAADHRRKQELKRQVQEGIQEQFVHGTLAGEGLSSAKSWAKRMKKSQHTKKKASPDDSQNNPTIPKNDNEYGEEDLKGITVGHSLDELAEGSTTVLTLSDAPILKTNADNRVIGLNEDDDAQELQNVNLAQDRQQQTGLREKRRVEMAMGRANGYTGWDDDEFAELGGAHAASQLPRGTIGGTAGAKGKVKGFRIGSHLLGDDEEEEAGGGASRNKSVSLVSSGTDVVANDFMTAEEAELERMKEMKTFKKKSKKDKKKKKKKRRTQIESDDEDDRKQSRGTETDLLDMLEETAVDQPATKRRREEDGAKVMPDVTTISSQQPSDETGNKRSRYEQVMAKGNERSRAAFGGNAKNFQSTLDGGEDEEPDDAFLNAALAKARRLHRLKEMKRGADVVLDTLQKQPDVATSSTSAGTITFEVDETREFARAIQARSEQIARKAPKKEETKNVQVETVNEESNEKLDLAELAKNMEEDNVGDLEGTTGDTKALGPGVGNVLQLLQQTGDLTSKTSGKEQLRGRAKDERNYEDYESVDLSEVVKIDHRTAHAKDKEMAQREVKLEYRDSHGRLLTRKEAYRELCYQFHGHGSGKRKEEKKLQQIAREQAEASVASRDGAGTFGALQAAQKASGKAFIVHKTGKN